MPLVFGWILVVWDLQAYIFLYWPKNEIQTQTQKAFFLCSLIYWTNEVTD